MSVSEKEAKALARNYAVAEYKVPAKDIVIINTVSVVGALIWKSSYGIEIWVIKDGLPERHQLAVNTVSGEVALIY